MSKMKWYFIDNDYLDYLRDFENRIPKTDYGQDKFKPFFGSLFEVENLVYVTQVSHAKYRHQKLKANLDFIKIYNNNDDLIAIVNLNYMFPVPKNYLIECNYKEIEKFRSFKNDIEKSKYINLLKKELKSINNNSLDIKAKQLYDFKYKFPQNSISKRCLEFKELEKMSILYEKKIQLNNILIKTKDKEIPLEVRLKIAKLKSELDSLSLKNKNGNLKKSNNIKL